MNREIEYITNITASAVLDTSGIWTWNMGACPPADECVVRQVTYSSSNAFHPVYQVYSTLTNSAIASVCAIPGFTSCPGTRLQLRTQPQATLTFQILLTTGASTTGALADFVSINLDFIKYRR